MTRPAGEQPESVSRDQSAGADAEGRSSDSVVFDITPGGPAPSDGHDASTDYRTIAAVVAVIAIAVAVGFALLTGSGPEESSATTAATPTTALAPTIEPIAEAVSTTPPDRPSAFETVATSDTFPTLPAGSGAVDWAIAPMSNPLSAYGMSLRSLAGASPGFVAIAGIEVTPFQRPVWISTDGMTWTEVDPADYDNYVASTVVGTADALFLQANDATRPIGDDRTGAQRLYRSTDLATWELVDDDFVGDLTTAGTAFITRVDGARLESSGDGSTWVTVPLPEGARVRKQSLQRLGEVGVMFTVASGNGEDQTLLTNHVAEPIPIPTPPFGGTFVSTPWGSLTLVNPARPACEDELQEGLNAAASLTADGVRRIYQGCAAPPATYRTGSATGIDDWQRIPILSTMGATVTTPVVASIGDQLVAIVTDTQLNLSLWSTPADEVAWSFSGVSIPGATSRLPRPPWVASDGEHVVVIPTGYRYESRTPVMVATLR